MRAAEVERKRGERRRNGSSDAQRHMRAGWRECTPIPPIAFVLSRNGSTDVDRTAAHARPSIAAHIEPRALVRPAAACAPCRCRAVCAVDRTLDFPALASACTSALGAFLEVLSAAELISQNIDGGRRTATVWGSGADQREKKGKKTKKKVAAHCANRSINKSTNHRQNQQNSAFSLSNLRAFGFSALSLIPIEKTTKKSLFKCLPNVCACCFHKLASNLLTLTQHNLKPVLPLLE